MSDITCDLSGLTAKNLLKLSSLCLDGNAYLKTDYSVTPPIIPSPLNIVTSCDCEFWFDGQDEDTVNLFAATNRVFRWDDKSGNARHVANAVDAQRPTWNPATGRLTFVFANTTYLQSAPFAPLVQPNTIYVLYKITGALDNTGVAFDGITLGNVIYYSGSTFKLHVGVLLNNGATDVNDNIHTAEFNGAASNYWINGVLVAGPANVGANALDGITLGADRTLAGNIDGEIMEVFGYNCVLTPAERAALDAYLTSKWGL